MGTWSRQGAARKRASNPNSKCRTISGPRLISRLQQTAESAGKSPSPKAFLNTTTKDIEICYSHTRTRGQQWSSAPRETSPATLHLRRSSTSAASAQSMSPNLETESQRASLTQRSPETDQLLLDYYVNVVCVDNTHVRPDDEDDPRQHILRRASLSPDVSLGVMMLAAHLWALSNPEISVLAIEYRLLVLKIMQQSLECKTSDPGDIMMLATMLCAAEVSLSHSY